MRIALTLVVASGSVLCENCQMALHNARCRVRSNSLGKPKKVRIKFQYLYFRLLHFHVAKAGAADGGAYSSQGAVYAVRLTKRILVRRDLGASCRFSGQNSRPDCGCVSNLRATWPQPGQARNITETQRWKLLFALRRRSYFILPVKATKLTFLTSSQ